RPPPSLTLLPYTTLFRSRFFRARRPWIRTNFFRLEFAFECEQDVPLVLVKIDHLHPNHLRRLVCFLSGLDRFSTNMSDAERENSDRKSTRLNSSHQFIPY